MKKAITLYIDYELGLKYVERICVELGLLLEVDGWLDSLRGRTQHKPVYTKNCMVDVSIRGSEDTLAFLIYLLNKRSEDISLLMNCLDSIDTSEIDSGLGEVVSILNYELPDNPKNTFSFFELHD